MVIWSKLENIEGVYSLLLLVNVHLNVPFRCIGSDGLYWNLLLNSVSIQCTSSLQNLRIKTTLRVSYWLVLLHLFK